VFCLDTGCLLKFISTDARQINVAIAMGLNVATI
jgi:hypothetical protein